MADESHVARQSSFEFLRIVRETRQADDVMRLVLS